MSTRVGFEQLSQLDKLEEAWKFFMGEGMLRHALDILVADLNQNGIDYAVIGGLALNLHGYTRATVDIDLLLTKEGFSEFCERLVGAGYRQMFAGGSLKVVGYEKSFRMMGSPWYGLIINIVTTGEYPGDGLPKPVRFPDPDDVAIVIERIRTVPLDKLIELKLASGISGAARLKDLADVQEVIKVKRLPKAFAERLDPSVRPMFIELYDEVILANLDNVHPE